MSGSATGSADSAASASSTKSYHNGGVESDSLEAWYEEYLAEDFSSNGSGSGGSKGSVLAAAGQVAPEVPTGDLAIQVVRGHFVFVEGPELRRQTVWKTLRICLQAA